MTTQSKYPEDPRVGENIFETTQISHSLAINHAQIQQIHLKKNYKPREGWGIIS